MAQPTNLYDTFDTTGIREDLTDVIYNISPEDTPILSAIPRTAAKGTKHEWQLDALAAPAANSVIEGDDATIDAMVATTRAFNFTQIQDKVIALSGTQSSVDAAGRADEMAYQIAKKSKELKKEIGENSKHSKDLELLVSQAKRCSDILRQISRKEIEDDQFNNIVKVEDLLEEIIISFKETTDVKIDLISDEDKNKINIKRAPELVYGLRNFIGNAVKFSKSKVNINLKSDEKIIKIKINDDGPGIPEDVIEKIGEPYIKSKSKEISSNSGLGLGTFLGKTLLEKQNAKLLFRKNDELGGALVVISWSLKELVNV